MLLRRSPLVAALLASGFAGTVAADQPEVIVVVGETTDRILDSAAIERSQALDLEDLFRFEPSVTVGGGLGLAQKIYVRELEDTYLHVTVDGAPQTSTLFHHVGRVSIEPELLEQVEVQAGAGEATSGPGALGGAVRFMTKDADSLLRGNARVGARAKVGFFDNSNGYKTSATGYGRLTDNINLLLSGVHAEFNDFRDGNGEVVPATGTEQNVMFAKLSGDAAAHSYSLSHERRRETGDLGRQPNQQTRGEARFATEGVRNTTIANYAFDPAQGSLSEIAVTLYRTQAEFSQDTGPERWGIYGGEVESSGGDVRGRVQLGQHAITVGVDHREDEVTSAYLSDRALWEQVVAGMDDTSGRYGEEGSVSGVYAQDHWQLVDSLLLSFGARYDQYEFEGSGAALDDSAVSVNGGLNWTFLPGWTASLGYAEAFRGKLISDSFTLEGAAVDPNLESEEADNTELALRYSQGGFLASATVYRANIDNVIHDQQGNTTVDGQPFRAYFENIGDLQTEGFELRAAYQWNAHYLALAYHASDSEIDNVPIGRGVPAPDPAPGAPPLDPVIDDVPVSAFEYQGIGTSVGDTLSLMYEWQPSSAWTVTAGWRYTDRVEDLEVLARSAYLGWTDQNQTIDKPGYGVADLGVEWRPVELFSLSLSVQNLFDKAYRHHASVEDYSDLPPDGDWDGVVGPMEAGRDIRLTVGMEF